MYLNTTYIRFLSRYLNTKYNFVYEIRILNTCIWNTAHPCIHKHSWISVEKMFIAAWVCISSIHQQGQMESCLSLYQPWSCSRTSYLKNIAYIYTEHLAYHCYLCNVIYILYIYIYIYIYIYVYVYVYLHIYTLTYTYIQVFKKIL